MLNVGIVGAGRIGRVHARSLAYTIPTARIAAIADEVVEAARLVADQFRIPRVFQHYQEMLEMPDLDAVLICSSTDTHADIIVDAARAGKHIFCEKPIAKTLPSIDRALDAAEKAGVKLQIGFNRRFDTNYRRVRQAIETGEIGVPAFVHIISRDPAPPPIEYVKVSGGIFLDMTIHDFDMARYLVGAEVDEVYATGSVRVDPAIGEAGDLDTVFVVLKFENGVVATIDNSRQAVYGYDQRVEAFGTGGKISTDNNFPNAAVLSDAHSVHRDLPLYFFLERYAESFAKEMAEFVDAVLHDKPTPVTGADGRAPVVMGLAARRSVDENRPVKISEVSLTPEGRAQAGTRRG
ncbi:MAG: inositol 2-dehydrogenase [Anaerolineae bacterium]